MKTKNKVSRPLSLGEKEQMIKLSESMALIINETGKKLLQMEKIEDPELKERFRLENF